MPTPTTTRPTAEALNAAIVLWQDALKVQRAALAATQAAYQHSVNVGYTDEAHEAHKQSYTVWRDATLALQKAHAEAQALYTAYNR